MSGLEIAIADSIARLRFFDNGITTSVIVRETAICVGVFKATVPEGICQRHKKFPLCPSQYRKALLIKIWIKLWLFHPAQIVVSTKSSAITV